MFVTFFESYRKPAGLRRDLSWGGMLEAFRKPRKAAEKTDTACWSPTVFDGDKRAKAGALELSCLSLDFDNDGDRVVSTDEVHFELQSRGVTYATMPTWKALTEGAPRFRLVVPLVSPVPADRWGDWLDGALAATGLDGLLHGVDVPILRDTARLFFLPATPEGCPVDVFDFDGYLLDVPVPEPKAEEQPRRVEIPRVEADSPVEKYVAEAVEAECERVATAGKGQRNHALNSAAFNLGTLVGAGVLDQHDAASRLEAAAAMSDLTKDDGTAAVDSTIRSGLESGKRKPRDMSDIGQRRKRDDDVPAEHRDPPKVEDGAIERWIRQKAGIWNVQQLDRDLGLRGADAATRRDAVIEKLVEAGDIARHNDRTDQYRPVDKTLTPILLSAKQLGHELPVILPFGLSEYVRVMPKNIIVIAGESNTGKTALGLRIALDNAKSFSVRYLSSEMSEQELNERAVLFAPLEDWPTHRVHFFERTRDFHEALLPNDVNIIDYLEIHGGEFSKIADYIRSIHDKLDRGVAFIMLQKGTGAEMGRGGDLSIEKARLYLSLFHEIKTADGVIVRAKVKKAKLFRKGMNPDGRELYCEVVSGHRISFDRLEAAQFPCCGKWTWYGPRYAKQLKQAMAIIAGEPIDAGADEDRPETRFPDAE